jgi:hypothetical protein
LPVISSRPAPEGARPNGSEKPNLETTAARLLKTPTQEMPKPAKAQDGRLKHDFLKSGHRLSRSVVRKPKAQERDRFQSEAMTVWRPI